MITKNMKIEISTGLEARPVAVFVQVASQFESSIYVEVGNKKVNAKSIMGMMTLGLDAGEEVLVSAAGNDEKDAIAEIEKYLTKRFVGLKPTPINDNNKPRHAIERKTFSIDLIFKVLNRIETRYNNIPHN